MVAELILPDASLARIVADLVPISEQTYLELVFDVGNHLTVTEGEGSQVSVTVAISLHCKDVVLPTEFKLNTAFLLVIFGADLSGEHWAWIKPGLTRQNNISNHFTGLDLNKLMYFINENMA